MEEKIDALHLNKNEIYKFLGFELADKIDVKRVMERVKKEIRKRLDHLTGLNLNDRNLMLDESNPLSSNTCCWLRNIYMESRERWFGRTGHDSEKCITERRIP